MEKQILQPEQAWQEFYATLKSSEDWSVITRPQKQYLAKISAIVRECAALKTKFPVKSMQAAFDKYAPGMFALVDPVFQKLISDE